MSRLHSYADELRVLQHEEDLIQIHTPNRSRVSSISSARHQEGALPTPQTQISLLDLDEHLTPLQETGQNRAAERSRAPNYGRASSRTLSQEACDQCGQYGPGRDYCNVCDSLFCKICWQMQIPHKRRTLAFGSIPHEVTDHLAAKKIKSIIEGKPTGNKQEEAHINDQDTTWFGISWEDVEFPLFRDYGRYADLMAESNKARMSGSGTDLQQDHRNPSLVSFVGETGAGKSTVIKLIIDLLSTDGYAHATPVAGPSGADNPTSGDVHLYSDPRSSFSQTPILYADCEGLDGGEREPLASKFLRKEQASKTGGARISQTNLHTSEREITWATTNTKRTRAFAVSHLYPRLLYTFSDIIVFVLKNPRVIEKVLEKLVEWAAAALEKSSNQPALPHAIVVLNASDNDIDEALWDCDNATSQLFESLSRVVFQNNVFKEYAQFWRERNRSIESVNQLLYSFYASVKVVRIPTTGRPNLIQEQIHKLYKHIRLACELARKRKAELRMLLDGDELQPYLQFAFDHFARDLDTPFDFVQASFVNSPIPLNFGGNILKLAINIMDVWRNQIDGHTIFEELSYMVASCIMLDSARSKLRGTASRIFPEYIEHLDAALENFCDRHWPCEYVKPGGGARCVNVRSGHGSKGHQLKTGKVLAIGGYVSNFTFQHYRKTFEDSVFFRLNELLNTLHQQLLDCPAEDEAQTAANIHRDIVMVHFYEHAARGQAEAFISHTTCFSCLVEPPEHALPCGHILCTSCLRAYGKMDGNRYNLVIHGCPLEPQLRPSFGAWRMTLKPASAGVRVLSLDGGGIRGVVELEVLRQIENAMGGQLPIQSFFDLIVGTSTGGLIALGLVARNWSVEECSHHYEDLCKQIFTKRFGCNIPGVSWFVESYNHSKYETRPLQDALVNAFSESEYLFGGNRAHTSGNDIKVVVTATSQAGKPVVFSNYNRLCNEKLLYHFQRPEKYSLELKVWEAARATAAAPRIFKPFHHIASNQIYLDGAICHNNPVQIADKERKLLWPSLIQEHPDVFVSIGTCYNAARDSYQEESRAPRRGIFSHGKSLIKIAIDHIALALDSEKAWHSYMTVLDPPLSHRKRYIRINPRLQQPPPRMDDVDSMLEIQETARQLIDAKMIRNLASRLIASSFYFETSRVESAGNGAINIKCKGHIQCRLPTNSREIGNLGHLLKEKSSAYSDLAFVVQEEHRPRKAQSIPITPDVIESMVRNGHFRMTIQVTISDKLAKTAILLRFGQDDNETFPLSQFPRSLIESDRSAPAVHHKLAVNHNRWAGRTPSQQRRRKEWNPPQLSKEFESPKISRYSSKDYVIGDSTPTVLRKIASRLMNGPNPVPNNPDAFELEAENYRKELSQAEEETSFASPLIMPLLELHGNIPDTDIPMYELEANVINVAELGDCSPITPPMPNPFKEGTDASRPEPSQKTDGFIESPVLGRQTAEMTDIASPVFIPARNPTRLIRASATYRR